VTFQRDRLGASGVFKKIVEGARKVRRALSESDGELTPAAQQIGDQIGEAFVAGRFADVYALGAAELQRTRRGEFIDSWRETVADRGVLTGFDVASVGQIDLGFIPGLEEVPQSEFAAFVEIAFATAGLAADDEGAFVVGAVLLDRGGELRLGALHTR
jgi:hypothetical protein